MIADLAAEIHMIMMHQDVARSSAKEMIHIEGNATVDIREVIFHFFFLFCLHRFILF